MRMLQEKQLTQADKNKLLIGFARAMIEEKCNDNEIKTQLRLLLDMMQDSWFSSKDILAGDFFCDFRQNNDSGSALVVFKQSNNGRGMAKIEFNFTEQKIYSWYEYTTPQGHVYANADNDTIRLGKIDINEIDTSYDPNRKISGKKEQFYKFVNEVRRWYLRKNKLPDKKLEPELMYIYNKNAKITRQADRQGAAYNGYPNNQNIVQRYQYGYRNNKQHVVKEVVSDSETQKQTCATIQLAQTLHPQIKLQANAQNNRRIVYLPITTNQFPIVINKKPQQAAKVNQFYLNKQKISYPRDQNIKQECHQYVETKKPTNSGNAYYLTIYKPFLGTLPTKPDLWRAYKYNQQGFVKRFVNNPIINEKMRLFVQNVLQQKASAKNNQRIVYPPIITTHQQFPIANTNNNHNPSVSPQYHKECYTKVPFYPQPVVTNQNQVVQSIQHNPIDQNRHYVPTVSNGIPMQGQNHIQQIQQQQQQQQSEIPEQDTYYVFGGCDVEGGLHWKGLPKQGTNGKTYKQFIDDNIRDNIDGIQNFKQNINNVNDLINLSSKAYQYVDEWGMKFTSDSPIYKDVHGNLVTLGNAIYKE